MEIFDEMRERAITMAKTAFMESGRPFPADDAPVYVNLVLPLLGIGIAAASEYLAEHPEHLPIAGSPICTECREPIQTLQVGVDPSPSDEAEPIRVAWPCGHRQS